MTRIVIVAPSWLGDAVMALPAIADVRRAAPATSIVVAARRAVAPLFRFVSCVDDVVTLGPAKNVSETRALSACGADAALLLPNSFHAALTVARAGIPERWGYRTEWRGFLLTRGVPPPPSDTHQIEWYRSLVQALGFPNGASDPELELQDSVRAAGANALRSTGWDGRTPLVALAPGAAFGNSKRWPPERFAELAEALSSDGIMAVLLGSAADMAAGKAVEHHLRNGVSVLNLVGATDLHLLAGVLVNCRALVGNDSGATHLAAALGVRVTAVFGPTDERITGLRGPHRIVTNPVWCRPCYLRECPLDHECMRGVAAGRVFDAARVTW